ncbi:MAG TPA: caspase family protein [Campylobacterales bacterium]|nr:caspase family protein [Campylobacterales bacterium]
MKKLLLILLILSNTTLWAKKVALIVGVNSVGSFLFIETDVQLMENLLTKAGFKVKTLKGSKASLQKIREEFKRIHNLNLTKEDTFLFYYTGHGGKMRDINPKKVDNFFALSHTSFVNDHTIGGGVLSDKEYSMLLHNIKAKKISIVDACYSGTIYKNLSTPKYIKSISPKGLGQIFQRANSVESFKSYKLENFINISATNDNQTAENSPLGSIFTVALTNLIKANPNITFATLEKELRRAIKPTARKIAKAREIVDRYPIYRALRGNFTPEMHTSPLAMEQLRVKDIFVKPKKANPSLENTLNQKPKKMLTIKTSDEKKRRYEINSVIKFNIISSIKHGYLYLFEKKKNNYTLLGERNLQKCQNMGKKKYCKFDDIFASKPLGKSVVYAVITKKALQINNQSIKKELKITEDFFEVKEDLAKQITKERVDGVSLTLWVEE